jgi:putative transposase
MKRTFKPMLLKWGLSRSAVSRTNKRLYAAFETWRKRSLAKERIVFLFLDGIYLGVRRGSSEKEAILVAHGIRENGDRVLLGVWMGPKESAEAWSGAVGDLVARGLKVPSLVIGDGNKGLRRAVREVFGKVPFQNCTVHKTRNVLARVPKKNHGEVKAALGAIFHANNLNEALRAANAFHAKFGDRFPTATETLARNLDACLSFYAFPEACWKRIRTSNVVERNLKEVRRRTDVAGRYPTERTALALIFGVLEENALRWNGIREVPKRIEDIRSAAAALIAKPPVVKWARRMAA